jgi:hypothetical protein
MALKTLIEGRLVEAGLCGLQMLRVEKCERLQLIAASVRICISSCHDCIFYLGVNRPPLLIGDNRFIQVGHSPENVSKFIVMIFSCILRRGRVEFPAFLAAGLLHGRKS